MRGKKWLEINFLLLSKYWLHLSLNTRATVEATCELVVLYVILHLNVTSQFHKLQLKRICLLIDQIPH